MLLRQIVLQEARLNDQQIKNIAPKLLAAIVHDHSVPDNIKHQAEQATNSKDDHQILNVVTQIIDSFKENVDPSPNNVNMSWIMKTYNNREWLWEDHTNIHHQLTEFIRVQNSPELVIKNLDQYKTLDQLITALEPFAGRELVSKKQEKKQSRDVMYDQTKVIYRDKDVVVLTPLTEDAAKYFGKNTRWCTTWEKNNQFNHYNSQGPLFIIMCRDETKWQFHYESSQFKDSADREIHNRRDWADKYPTAANALRNQSIAFGQYDLIIGTITPEEFIQAIGALLDSVEHASTVQEHYTTKISALLNKCENKDAIPDECWDSILRCINQGKLDTGILMSLPEKYQAGFNIISYISNNPSGIELLPEDKITDNVVDIFGRACANKQRISLTQIVGWISNITEKNQKRLTISAINKYKIKQKVNMPIGFMDSNSPIFTWNWFWTDATLMPPLLFNRSDYNVTHLLTCFGTLTQAQQQKNIPLKSIMKVLSDNPTIISEIQSDIKYSYQYNTLPSCIVNLIGYNKIVLNNPTILLDKNFPSGYNSRYSSHLCPPIERLPKLFDLAVNLIKSTNSKLDSEHKNKQRNPKYKYIPKEVVQQMVQKNPIAACLMDYNDQTPDMLANILGYLEGTNNKSVLKWALSSMGAKSITKPLLVDIKQAGTENINLLPKSINKTDDNQLEIFNQVLTSCLTSGHMYWHTLPHLLTYKLTKEQLKTLYNAAKKRGALNGVAWRLSLAKLSNEQWQSLAYYFPNILNRVTSTKFEQFVNSGNDKMVLMVLSKKGQFLIKLPEEDITLDMARVAIAHKRSLFKSPLFPEKFKSDDIIKKMAKTSNPDARFALLPQTIQDKIKLVENVTIFQSDLFNMLFEHKIKGII